MPNEEFAAGISRAAGDLYALYFQAPGGGAQVKTVIILSTYLEQKGIIIPTGTA
jgi:hypothetical protein